MAKKAASLRDNTVEELQQLLRESEGELIGMKVKRGMGDATQQPLRIRTLRKDVARIKTIIRERELKK